MSKFAAEVVRVTIEPHPNADALEIARVGDFLSLVRKGDFVTGQLAVYLPQDAVLPQWLLKHIGMWDSMNGKGMLGGSQGNRVRPKRLRGIFSEGILLAPSYHIAKTIGQGDETITDLHAMACFPAGDNSAVQAAPGDDVQVALGVTRYEPELPTHMAGNAAGGDLDATFGYDFDNIKKTPEMFADGEQVVITEKIHGTLLQVGLIPPSIWEGKAWAEKCPSFTVHGKEWKGIVTSKGQGGRGIMLDPSDAGNLYVKTVLDLKIWEKLADNHDGEEIPAFLFGEIFGAVQKGFDYGVKGTTFRVFDIVDGSRNKHRFVDFEPLRLFVESIGLELVPVLYEGPFSKEVLAYHTNGSTTLGGAHIREGVVVKTAVERRDPMGRRCIAKSVSEAYLEAVNKGKVSDF